MIIAASVVAFAVTFCSMFGVLRFANRNGLYDSVGGRKIHTGKVPRLGGIAIFLGFAAAVAACIVMFRSGISDLGRATTWYTLALGAVVMFALGLFDDLKPIAAKTKLLVQIVVAVAIASDGWRFGGIGIYPDFLSFGPAWISVILTAGWVVGITNAMNLIDGIDGLAGGLAAIASATFGVMYLRMGNTTGALLAFTVCGSALGFLVHNFPFPGQPARIFMGDSGSLFLGYALAVVPLAMPLSASTAVSGTPANTLGLLAPFTVLAIPILDTLNAIRRRTKAHVSFAVADRRHLHHILLGLGLSVRQILAVLYSVAIVLSGAALLSLDMSPTEGAILILSVLAVLALAWVLVYFRHDSSSVSFAPGEASRARKVIRK